MTIFLSALEQFVGIHDFAAFTNRLKRKKQNKRKEIIYLQQQQKKIQKQQQKKRQEEQQQQKQNVGQEGKEGEEGEEGKEEEGIDIDIDTDIDTDIDMEIDINEVEVNTVREIYSITVVEEEINCLTSTLTSSSPLENMTSLQQSLINLHHKNYRIDFHLSGRFISLLEC